MDEKILIFLDTEKDDVQASPLEPEAIMQHLQSIPEDIVHEYNTFTTDYIEKVLLMKNIIQSATVNPQLCRHLVEGLDKEQLTRLNKIVLHLSAKDMELQIKEIAEAGFDLIAPTPESRSRALSLVNHIKALKNHEVLVNRLTTFYRQFKFLSESIAILDLGPEYENLIIDRFTPIHENDLDVLKQIADKMIIDEEPNERK